MRLSLIVVTFLFVIIFDVAYGGGRRYSGLPSSTAKPWGTTTSSTATTPTSSKKQPPKSKNQVKAVKYNVKSPSNSAAVSKKNVGGTARTTRHGVTSSDDHSKKHSWAEDIDEIMGLE